MARKDIRYSEAFKLQVVCEPQFGALDGIEHGRRRYGIAGGGTVQGWLRKYGSSEMSIRDRRAESAI